MMADGHADQPNIIATLSTPDALPANTYIQQITWLGHPFDKTHPFTCFMLLLVLLPFAHHPTFTILSIAALLLLLILL